MPFEPGNKLAKGGRRDKPWRDALNRAIKRHAEGDLQALDRAADQVVIAAIEGKMDAIKEIGDRLDGKPVQALANDEDNPLIPPGITEKEIDERIAQLSRKAGITSADAGAGEG